MWGLVGGVGGGCGCSGCSGGGVADVGGGGGLLPPLLESLCQPGKMLPSGCGDGGWCIAQAYASSKDKASYSCEVLWYF